MTSTTADEKMALLYWFNETLNKKRLVLSHAFQTYF